MKPNTLFGKSGKKDQKTAHPYPNFELNPNIQNIPLDPSQSQLRPPPPVLEPGGEATAQIFVGAAAYRDGKRCGDTILDALQRAKYPDRVRVAVVDQAIDEEADLRCIQAYCDAARQHYYKQFGEHYGSGGKGTTVTDCPRRNQIFIDERHAPTFSKGPVVARHHLQQLINDDDVFCVGIDGHSMFTNSWDMYLIKDWKDTENEMAVISTYVHHGNEHNIARNGNNKPYDGTPHICDIKVGSNGVPRNEGATNIHNATRPNLSSKWGAGYSFSKCHSERRVPIDAHAMWVFDGEEISRAAQLFMAGYDMYSPSMHGHAIYHNYTANRDTYTWDKKHEVKDQKEKDRQMDMGYNRIKLHIGLPFVGKVNTVDFEDFDVRERGIAARSLDQYLKFVNIDYHKPDGTSYHVNEPTGENWNHTCHQLHWVPYEHPELVEELLPGWTMIGSESGKADSAASRNMMQQSVMKDATECMYHGTCDHLAELSGGLCSGGMLFGILMGTNLFTFCAVILFIALRRKEGLKKGRPTRISTNGTTPSSPPLPTTHRLAHRSSSDSPTRPTSRFSSERAAADPSVRIKAV